MKIRLFIDTEPTSPNLRCSQTYPNLTTDLILKFRINVWEQRKAKEVFKSFSEKEHESYPVLSVTQDQGVVYRDNLDIDIKYDPATLSNYKVVHPYDFVISLRSFQGGFELSEILGISSPAYTIFNFISRENHNCYYWKFFFKTYKFIESLKKVTFGIRDGKSISFTEFSSLKLCFPSTYEEQKQIGELFNKIVDNLIAANQCNQNKPWIHKPP